MLFGRVKNLIENCGLVVQRQTAAAGCANTRVFERARTPRPRWAPNVSRKQKGKGHQPDARDFDLTMTNYRISFDPRPLRSKKRTPLQQPWPSRPCSLPVYLCPPQRRIRLLRTVGPLAPAAASPTPTAPPAVGLPAAPQPIYTKPLFMRLGSEKFQQGTSRVSPTTCAPGNRFTVAAPGHQQTRNALDATVHKRQKFISVWPMPLCSGSRNKLRHRDSAVQPRYRGTQICCVHAPAPTCSVSVPVW